MLGLHWNKLAESCQPSQNSKCLVKFHKQTRHRRKFFFVFFFGQSLGIDFLQQIHKKKLEPWGHGSAEKKLWKSTQLKKKRIFQKHKKHMTLPYFMNNSWRFMFRQVIYIYIYMFINSKASTKMESCLTTPHGETAILCRFINSLW